MFTDSARGRQNRWRTDPEPFFFFQGDLPKRRFSFWLPFKKHAKQVYPPKKTPISIGLKVVQLGRLTMARNLSVGTPSKVVGGRSDIRRQRVAPSQNSCPYFQNATDIAWQYLCDALTMCRCVFSRGIPTPKKTGKQKTKATTHVIFLLGSLKDLNKKGPPQNKPPVSQVCLMLGTLFKVPVSPKGKLLVRSFRGRMPIGPALKHFFFLFFSLCRIPFASKSRETSHIGLKGG